jgi:hypothetical protein
LQDIASSLDKGNIGDTGEIVGRQTVTEHDPRDGAEELTTGLEERVL